MGSGSSSRAKANEQNHGSTRNQPPAKPKKQTTHQKHASTQQKHAPSQQKHPSTEQNHPKPKHTAIKTVAHSKRKEAPGTHREHKPVEKPKVVFVLGGPGAGKGTQCANIVEEFGWVHLSAGDLLRAEQATNSADSKLIKDYIKDGKIVPVEITIRLLLKAMHSSKPKRFLIDGFPRSMDNREGWEKQVGDQVEELFCLNFECSMEELERRLLKRGETSGRADDNLESIKKRFVAFQEQTKPVLDYFEEKGMLRTVNSGQEVEAVWAETRELFEKPKVVFVLGGPGAGKGTQCANIVEEFGWVHLSAGDLLRAEQATNSADSKLIKDYIKDGKIVPVEITIRLLLKAMHSSKPKRFLIDGFPRSMDNREGWEKQVGDQVEELFCLNFECSMEELERRLLKRGETSGRADDNLESIKKRFVAFQEQTKPVLDYFEEKGMLRTVNSGQEVEAVWAETRELFEKPKVVFVLGGPGAGKGTQCANIVEEFGWVHLSAGDLLRAEQATNSADSKLIKDYIKDGKIVPVEITIRLLLKAMHSSKPKRFLIDGFPRSMDNREGWEKQVGDQVEELFCLNFECSMEELERRLLKRGETSGRADDNLESIKKRFVAFQSMTVPVLQLFKRKGMLRTVNSGQEVEAVWAETEALFQAYEETGSVGPKALVIAGPSGVGKGTLIERLTSEFPAAFGFSVSHTTRGPRPGEEDGVHYHFSTREAMEGAIARGEFIEHAEVHGNLYGTSKEAVERVGRSGRICVLDIDVQGVRAVRRAALPATFCFVAPPSMKALGKRLRGRGTETEEKIKKRLHGAKKEMAAKDEPGLFDYQVVNDDVEAAYGRLRELVLPELESLGFEAGGGERESAFVFVKPHANTAAVQGLVRARMAEAGVAIVAEGEIGAEEIEARKLIDQHYRAIASKATMQKPAELAVPEDKFEESFGEAWTAVLKEGRAMNAMEMLEAVGEAALAKQWDAAKAAGRVVKLGGGFYCGLVDERKRLYTFNAFFIPLRQSFTAAGASLHFFEVEWDPAVLPWREFRARVLGPTDPSKAPAGSLRSAILKRWKQLGLAAAPNNTFNGVHASASPLEGLAERVNWLGVEVEEDEFGRQLLAAGVRRETVAAWLKDPRVPVPGGAEGETASVFDQLEDTDVGPCLAKCKAIAAALGA